MIRKKTKVFQSQSGPNRTINKGKLRKLQRLVRVRQFNQITMIQKKRIIHNWKKHSNPEDLNRLMLEPICRFILFQKTLRVGLIGGKQTEAHRFQHQASFL